MRVCALELEREASRVYLLSCGFRDAIGARNHTKVSMNRARGDVPASRGLYQRGKEQYQR